MKKNKKNADRLIVLDKGSIVEIGTHKELVDKKGYYYQPIRKYWIDETKQNPIEVALKEIQSKLNDEKEKLKNIVGNLNVIADCL